MMLLKQKKSLPVKGNRFLISVSVLGSAGPIRFVVNEEELVAAVIDTALKAYAREGRLPILGSDLNDFTLYCPLVGIGGMNPWETIGSLGVRNFMLCKNPQSENAVKVKKPSSMSSKKGSIWKALFNKSLSLKVSSH